MSSNTAVNSKQPKSNTSTVRVSVQDPNHPLGIGPDGKMRYGTKQVSLISQKDPATGQQVYFDSATGRQMNYKYGDSTATYGTGSSINLKDLQAFQANQQKQADIKAAQMAKQGLNPDGSPIRPDFQSLRDPNTGLLKEQYQLTDQGPINVDQRAMDELRSQALSAGPSKYAQMAYDKQALEQEDQLNQSRAQSAGAQAQSQAALMMSGGLSSGARERLAASGDRNQMMAAQQVSRQGQLDRANIGLNDANLKNQMLNSTVANDLKMADVANQNRAYSTDIQKANLGNSIQDATNEQLFNMERYKNQMQAWGANKQADATARAGSGGKK